MNLPPIPILWSFGSFIKYAYSLSPPVTAFFTELKPFETPPATKSYALLAFSLTVAHPVNKNEERIKMIIFFDMRDYQKSAPKCQFI